MYWCKVVYHSLKIRADKQICLPALIDFQYVRGDSLLFHLLILLFVEVDFGHAYYIGSVAKVRGEEYCSLPTPDALFANI